MTKAETGVAGPVVAEMAYRNDYIAVRGQSKLAEEAWQKNRCQESKPEAKPRAGRAGSRCQGVRRAAGSKLAAVARISGAISGGGRARGSHVASLIRATEFSAHTRQS